MPQTSKANLLKHQTEHVFTPLPAGKLPLLVEHAPQIAKANGCIMLGPDTDMKWAMNDEHRLQGIVTNKKTGEVLSPVSKYGGLKVLVFGRLAGDESNKKFADPQHVFRDGLDVPMTGTEKQTFYIEPVDHPVSKAGVKQLLDLYNPAKGLWAKAVAANPKHAFWSTMKKKSGVSKQQVLDAAKQQVDRGNVFFPVHTEEREGDGEDHVSLRLGNKLVQNRRTYTPAVGTGFDIPIVDEYFAANKDSGLRLVTYLGRDNTPWAGKQADIKAVRAGFFIISLYPDYHAAKIGKFTMPHRLETIVVLDGSTASGGKSAFSVPDMQTLLGLPAQASDKENDTDVEEEDEAGDAAAAEALEAAMALKRGMEEGDESVAKKPRRTSHTS